jgi:hypothetical protein
MGVSFAAKQRYKCGMNTLRTPFALAACTVVAAVSVQAQPRQTVRPPQAQAWIDVATFSGLGMPMGGPGGAANPMSALGSLFGGRAGDAKVPFLSTQSSSSGRFVDVTLMTRNNPQLDQAKQEVPAGFLAPALQLIAPRDAPVAPSESEDDVVPEREPQRPEGKLYLYWGCGDSVRPGQPRVVDFATATPQQLAQVFQSRRATQRGAHSAVGRPHWPNPTDGRAIPEGASLAGAHQFTGSGVPEGFRFTLPAAQDLMPPMSLQQSDQGGATALSWSAQAHARAYFIAGMGARERNEMVLWTSSELPDAGMGLIDYQTNPAVDRWLKDKVLLAPSVTSCTIPKGVFIGEGAMLRAIAYGHELNLAHPPRPTDPKIAWEPQWAAKVRVKSVAMTMIGMPSMDMPARGGRDGTAPPPEPEKKEKKPSAIDILRGVIGR